MELVRRPSYTTRYRTVRGRYPNEGSPQRRTTTVVRRAPDSAVVEGKIYKNQCSLLIEIQNKLTKFLIVFTVCEVYIGPNAFSS
jgi:hypothetical protein